MSKNNMAGQRTNRQQTSTKIIVERHYVGTEKMEYMKPLVAMDKEKQLSEYIWNGIYAFNDIYENEMNLTK